MSHRSSVQPDRVQEEVELRNVLLQVELVVDEDVLRGRRAEGVY